MSLLKFEHVSLDVPVLGANSRSLRNALIPSASDLLRIDRKSRTPSVRVIQDVTFALEDGDRVALIGNNGAGKTSLLRLAGNIYSPSAGQVSRIGSVSSLFDLSFGLNREATGRRNLQLRASLEGISGGSKEELVAEAIAFAELGDFIDLPVKTYSTGMQMRLAFAITTLLSPDIMLLDEWLIVGDQDFQKRADIRLETQLSNAHILMMASHSREIIERHCNKVAILENGRLVEFGNSSSAVKQYFG